MFRTAVAVVIWVTVRLGGDIVAIREAMMGEPKMACYERRPKVKAITRRVFDETPMTMRA